MIVEPRAMRDAFLERIWRAMADEAKLFFVSADFGSPVLDRIRGDFPKRYVNVGIAEQNLVNVSAGLALEGFKVFAYAIAPFVTLRCYEQIRVNLALLSVIRPMNVTLIGVGAGYSYTVSGPTHQCFEDITVMRALPNVRVLSPADHLAAARLFDYCAAGGVNYLRLDAQVLPVVYPAEGPALDLGFHVHRRGRSVCLLATGFMLHTALQVAADLALLGHEVGVVDLFNLSEFASEELRRFLAAYSGIVTLEEGFSGRGGLDALMFSFLSQNSHVRMLAIGVPAQYRFALGGRTELHEQAGIGPNAVLGKIQDFIVNISV